MWYSSSFTTTPAASGTSYVKFVWGGFYGKEMVGGDIRRIFLLASDRPCPPHSTPSLVTRYPRFSTGAAGKCRSVNTNDGFVGIDSLTMDKNAAVKVYPPAYDAGENYLIRVWRSPFDLL